MKQLSRRLNDAVKALNAAYAEAQLVCPGATLYLEAEGILYALKPEPERLGRRDTTMSERQSQVIASSTAVARCDVGAW